MRLVLDQKGLTLIEMMVAAVIFAIGVLGIIALQGTILISQDFSGNQTVAKSLASERMDILMFTAYPNLQDCAAGVFCYADVDDGGGNLVASSINTLSPNAPIDYTGLLNPGGRFQRDWMVRPAPAPYAITAKQIQVRVQWNDIAIAGGQTGNPKLRTLTFDAIRMSPL